MSDNGNSPAMPSGVLQDGHNCGEYPLNAGLTKREMFCLHHGVANTGCDELDAIILKGNHQKAAMAAMQGLLVNMGRNGFDTVWQVASESMYAAGALLEELEKSQ